MPVHGQNTPRASVPPQAAGRRIGSIVASLKFELLIFALLAATVAALLLQDVVLKRTIVFKAEPGASTIAYTPYGYDDRIVGGRSQFVADPADPLHWTCHVNKGFQWAFCGLELLLGGTTYERGIDLSKFRSLHLDVSYDGAAETMRVHLKNADPRYTRTYRSDTTKPNKVEFDAVRGRQRVTLNLSDFSVADWWLTRDKIPPELSRPEFDNVVSIDISTGSTVTYGAHRIRVHSLTLEGYRFPKANWYLGILAIWMVLIVFFLAHRILSLKRDLKSRQLLQDIALRQAAEAEEAARRDHLTGVLNRAGVIEAYRQIADDRRACRSVTVVLIDIDYFKQLNDEFGHNFGDEVLADFARILRRNVRAEDIVGRWGGEEFIIICKDLDTRQAFDVAHKLRRLVEQFPFSDGKGVTASFGVHWSDRNVGDLSDLVSCADAALYAAKNQGRNRVVMYHPLVRAEAGR